MEASPWLGPVVKTEISKPKLKPVLYVVPSLPPSELSSQAEPLEHLTERLLRLTPETLLPVLKSILRNGQPATRELIAEQAHHFKVVSKAARAGLFRRMFNDAQGDVRSAIATTTEAHFTEFEEGLRGDLAQMLRDLSYEGSL